MPLTATQMAAECGTDVRTIDGTRWGRCRAVRADFLWRVLFPQWMKMKREYMGLSKYYLSRISGISRGAISQYEQGSRFPDGRNMERLLNTFWLTEREKETMFRQLYRDA